MQKRLALCAPQIGISKQVAIIDMEVEGLLQLFNLKLNQNPMIK